MNVMNGISSILFVISVITAGFITEHFLEKKEVNVYIGVMVLLLVGGFITIVYCQLSAVL